MILTDTGPLVALLDRADSSHSRCILLANSLPGGVLLTTWPCFTEAMHLLGGTGGFAAQSGLWKRQQAGDLALHALDTKEVTRIAALMEKYKDRPMDLADASLIAVAETRSLKQIFTLDGDFRFYRLADGSVLDVIPS